MPDEPNKPNEPVSPSGGSVDFSTQPKEVQELFEKLLEDKRQANKEAQETKKRLRDLESAKEAAERQALEEQSQFKSLYEKEKANREKLEAESNARLMSLLREKIGLQAGLPEALVSRLQGATEDEIRADAEALKAALPATPQAPKPSGTQTQTTPVPRGTPSGRTPEQIDAWLKNRDSGRSSNEPRQDGDVLVFGG